jgi:hypothetical protein
VTSNVGDGAANRSTTRYYLSLDSRRSPDDVLAGERSIRALDAGASSAGAGILSAPETLPAGRYHLLACADDLDEVVEVDESNQCRPTSLRVAVVRDRRR